MMFSDLSIRVSNDILQQIDAAIQRFQPALSDREEFVEKAVECVLQSLREESDTLRLSVEDARRTSTFDGH